LIDEVYSLGHTEKRDSFSKECLDTLTHNLGQEDTDFICIVAGYEDDVQACFFAHNKGLHRRFPFIYRIDGYDAIVMTDLMCSKLIDDGWTISPDEKSTITKFIETNKDKFENFMGDIENFILRLDIVTTSETVFSSTEKRLTSELLQKTFNDVYKGDSEDIQTKSNNNEPWRMMYT